MLPNEYGGQYCPVCDPPITGRSEPVEQLGTSLPCRIAVARGQERQS